MAGLACQLTEEGAEFVLRLTGEFFLEDADAFDVQTDRIFERKPERLVVDMRDLSAISSAGLGALLKLQTRARQNQCGMSLTALPQNIEQIFRLSRLDSVFTIM